MHPFYIKPDPECQDLVQTGSGLGIHLLDMFDGGMQECAQFSLGGQGKTPSVEPFVHFIIRNIFTYGGVHMAVNIDHIGTSLDKRGL